MATYLDLASLAAIADASMLKDVIFFDVPWPFADAVYYLEGQPGRLAVNLGKLIDIRNGTTFAADDPGHISIATGQATGNYTARIAGPVAGEAITINGVTYELDDITAASGDTTIGDDFNNVYDPLTVHMYPTLYTVLSPEGTDPLQVGDLIYIDFEYLRVTAVHGLDVTFRRAACGGVPAPHVATTGIFISVAPHAGTATNILVGSQATGAPVLPLVGTALFAATINEISNADDNTIIAESWAAGAFLNLYQNPQVVLAPLTWGVTTTGANFAWNSATMQRGAEAGRKRMFSAAITIDAAEQVTMVIIPLSFTPTQVYWSLIRTGAIIVWDGTINITPVTATLPAIIEFTDGGVVPFVVGDTLNVLAIE